MKRDWPRRMSGEGYKKKCEYCLCTNPCKCVSISNPVLTYQVKPKDKPQNQKQEEEEEVEEPRRRRRNNGDDDAETQENPRRIEGNHENPRRIEGNEDNPRRRNKEKEANEEEEEVKGSSSVEEILGCREVPPWWSQISVRGVVVSVIVGSLFCIVVHKLALTTGIVPSLHISAGLLSFFCIRTWMTVMTWMGFKPTPFTRQENTVIQTCIVACYGVAYSG